MYDKAKEMYLSGSTLPQIAEATGISQSTLRSRIYQGTKTDAPWKLDKPPPQPKEVKASTTPKVPTAEAYREALKYVKRAWIPHRGQQEVVDCIGSDLIDAIYVECGRKFGKSELATWLCWVAALSTPNAEVYYLAPAVKQARELVWANYRMQTCNTYDPDFLKNMEAIVGGKITVKDQEMRIYLPNKSFIKVDGSDNYNLQRGLKPDFVVADEYRDFKHQWLDAVRPNMAVKRGQMLFITTPPTFNNHARDTALEAQENVDGRWFYLNEPSYCNDMIPNHKEWLDKERERLTRLGKENVFKREYMAEFVADEENMIIPQLNETILRSDIGAIDSDNDQLEQYTAIFTAKTTEVAVLVAVIDRKTAKVTVLDAFTETLPEKIGASKMWPRIQRAISLGGLNLSKTHMVISRKNPSFARDLQDLYGIASLPSPLACDKVDHNLSLIKDLADMGQLLVSDRAAELTEQSAAFLRNETTLDLPARTPSLIECLKYVLEVSGYTHMAQPDDPAKPFDEDWLDKLEKSVPFEIRVRDAFFDQMYGLD